jgi:hypothetical protein
MSNEDQLAELDIYLLAPDQRIAKWNTLHRLAEIDPEEPLTLAMNPLQGRRFEIALGAEYVISIGYTPPKVNPYNQLEEISPVDHYRSGLS